MVKGMARIIGSGVPASGAATTFSFPSTYIVEKVGSAYHVKKRGSSSVYSNSSFKTALVDEAIAGLTAARTSPEKIVTVGDMAIDALIELPSNLLLELQGNWILADGVNTDIIQNADQATNNYNLIIEGNGYTIDGNGAQQTAGRGIELVHGTAAPSLYTLANWRQPKVYVLRNLNVRNCFAESYYVSMAGSRGNILMQQCSGHYSQSAVPIMNWASVPDSELIGGFFDANDGAQTHGIYVSGAMCHIRPDYHNGPSAFENLRNSTIEFPIADLGSDEDLMTLHGCWNNRVSGHFVAHGDGDANTHNAIELVAFGGFNCTDNIFNHIWAGRNTDDSGTRTFKYAVEETNAVHDYNTYLGISGRDCVTGAIRQLGVNGNPRANPADSIEGTVVLV